MTGTDESRLFYVAIGLNIRKYRELRNFSLQALGDMVGLTKKTIQRYENGEIKFDMDRVADIAGALEIDVSKLLAGTEKFLGIKLNDVLETRTVPLLGTIRAGLPILAEENWESEIEAPSTIKADFALRVEGDSMIYAGILPGDIVLLKQSNTANTGDIVAAGVEESAWSANLKYFVKPNGHYCLRSANPTYKDIEFTENHRIIGIMEGLIRETAPSVGEYKTFVNYGTSFTDEWIEVIAEAQAIGLNAEKVRSLIEIQRSMFEQLSKRK